jgi:membrane-associated protease RseP (regulator of RpoE activity)
VARPRPRTRPLVHLTLLLITAATLVLAGLFNWADSRAIDFDAPDAIRKLVASGIPYAFWALLILGAHEMGHYLACRYYRIPATLPFFIPGIPPLGSFGAVIRIRGAIPHRRALFDVAAAGPIAGFTIALPVMIVGRLTMEPLGLPLDADFQGWMYGRPLLVQVLDLLVSHEQPLHTNALFGAGWIGMLVTSLNLFPVGQLDGGHAAYAISRRLHRITTRLSLVALAGLVVYQVVGLNQTPAYVLWLVILLWMRDRHPRLLDETTPLGRGRKWVALLLLAMFLLSFIPVPITFTGG